jgi:hypothetical protein
MTGRVNVILMQMEADPQVIAEVLRALTGGLTGPQIDRRFGQGEAAGQAPSRMAAPADKAAVTKKVAPTAQAAPAKKAAPTAPKAVGGHIGLVELVRAAIQDGPKTNQGIREWLEKRGHAFDSAQISSSLIGLRNRNEIYKDDGDLK